jgi:hypothetical protein
LASLDEATRLEKKGDWEAATAEKNKAAEIAKSINMEIIKLQEQEAQGVRSDKRREAADIRAAEKLEAHDIRRGNLEKEVTQMRIDSDKELKKIEAGWRIADKSNADKDKLLRIWEVAQNARGTAESKIANLRKDPAYERAAEAAAMDPTSSPAAAKMQAQGKAQIEEFEKSFKTMRENADRTVSVIEDSLRERKVPLPSSTVQKFDPSKLTGDDKLAYDWANNPKSPGWTKEKADAIKKQLGG